MLRIDINGWKLSGENLGQRVLFPDGENESQFLSKFTGHIRPANHLINIRQRDLSLQSRAEFLLEGCSSDVSISLRTHNLEQSGWFVRLPDSPTVYETFFFESLKRHANQQINKQFVQLHVDGRGILLPARTHERPTRFELNVCSNVSPDNYRSTLFVQRLSRAVVLAITELGANMQMLANRPEKIVEVVEDVAQEIAPVKKRRSR